MSLTTLTDSELNALFREVQDECDACSYYEPTRKRLAEINAELDRREAVKWNEENLGEAEIAFGASEVQANTNCRPPIHFELNAADDEIALHQIVGKFGKDDVYDR